jgi:predicted O-methyltransferase YrrM
MPDAQYLDIVPVESLHERLGFSRRVDYPAASLSTPFSKWRMEVDDAPILRYLYREARPARHLEFGTWEGTGACYCLEECDAHVWTINVPGGELVDGQPAYSSAMTVVPEGALPMIQRNGEDVYQTDAGPFIGHRYRSAGFSTRVTQIYADTREWDQSEFAPGFFDTALVDGGHSEDVVLNDTRKALDVVKPGGLILWHDFCPDPSVFNQMASVVGVVGGLTREWPQLVRELRDVFWVQPSFLLVGVRR